MSPGATTSPSTATATAPSPGATSVGGGADEAVAELVGVSRWYGKVVAVSDVSLSLRPGVTALLGPNGAGKSTLLRLVLRFEDPRAGQVLLDGVDVRELDWDSLRGAIGYVAQDVYLFAGTVADNIRYGRSASAGCRSPGGSVSASPWPGRSCAIPPCSCSTRRPRRWTTRPRPRSSARWGW